MKAGVRWKAGLSVLCGLLSISGNCQMQGPVGGPMGSGRIVLNVVKLTTPTTTTRGPAVGDAVLAFNINGGLVWLKAGETTPQNVVFPSDVSSHDSSRRGFAFAGKKLVVKDANSGRIFVFDTETNTSKTMPFASIDLGASGLNLWEADGSHVATINASVTSQDGANRIVKVVDISDINNYAITPFAFDPASSPDGVSIDATNRRIAVRAGTSFLIYDIDNPNTAPLTFTNNAFDGSGDIRIRGTFLAFFDSNKNFAVLNFADPANAVVFPPARNPARPELGMGFNNGLFSYLTTQNADDGSTVAIINRTIFGNVTDPLNPTDASGTFVNGADATDGRYGFGAGLSISPNARFNFVAGSTGVEVGDEERLFLSLDGAAYLPVEDLTEATSVLRAGGVCASDNLVAFNIPLDPASGSFAETVGYATLPPP